MNKKIRVAIAGGTGYTGGELFRILLNHPDVEIVSATTTSSEGVRVDSVHRDLIGETDLCFGLELNDPDVIFLCLGHGISRQFVDTHDIKPECRIIDLGNDFRLDGEYAGRSFVYGLCESAREKVRSAHDVANPGCFATAIQLATLPLAASGLIKDEIHVTAITGSTGAGKKPGETTHFSYRSDNISIYKLFSHQHLAVRERVALGLIPLDIRHLRRFDAICVIYHELGVYAERFVKPVLIARGESSYSAHRRDAYALELLCRLAPDHPEVG